MIFKFSTMLLYFNPESNIYQNYLQISQTTLCTKYEPSLKVKANASLKLLISFHFKWRSMVDHWHLWQSMRRKMWSPPIFFCPLSCQIRSESLKFFLVQTSLPWVFMVCIIYKTFCTWAPWSSCRTSSCSISWCLPSKDSHPSHPCRAHSEMKKYSFYLFLW